MPRPVLLTSLALALTVAGTSAFVQPAVPRCVPRGVGVNPCRSRTSIARIGSGAGGSRARPARSNGSGGLRLQSDDQVSLRERTLSVLPYLLPALDGIDYGQYVYRAFPLFGDILYTFFAPELFIWRGIPFAPLVIFIGLTIVARQPSLSRFTRFNIQQAILLDIALVVLGLLRDLSKFIGGAAAGELASNFIFYCVAFTVSYCVLENSKGVAPNQIPVISQAADMQVGPF